MQNANASAPWAHEKPYNIFDFIFSNPVIAIGTIVLIISFVAFGFVAQRHPELLQGPPRVDLIAEYLGRPAPRLREGDRQRRRLLVQENENASAGHTAAQERQTEGLNRSTEAVDGTVEETDSSPPYDSDPGPSHVDQMNGRQNAVGNEQMFNGRIREFGRHSPIRGRSNRRH